MKTLDEEKEVETKPAVETVSVLLVDDETRNLDVLESILEPLKLRLVVRRPPKTRCWHSCMESLPASFWTSICRA